ncbi:MAG: SDR family NAD(P)-dependent oxidoreductase [Chloroflexi bacterium]|nr:MAG: SDR family NAD(P)-dependent oxidoreductase [Chloroflexota bacterium]
MEIAGLVVVVTGASAGIGRATAEWLAERGANVVLTARREARLQDLAQEYRQWPGERLVIPGDIRDETFARDLIHQTVDYFGRIDVLVNNAGLGHQSPIAEIPAADVRTILETNVLGLLYATQTAVSYMKKQNSGQIINVSSIVGQQPLPNRGIYCASKTAVNFITRSLRMELTNTPITVTLVYPGLTATEFGQARLGDKTNQTIARGVPARRVAQAIGKAIQKRRTEVYVTPYDWLFVHLTRLFPRTADWIITQGMAFITSRHQTAINNGGNP